MLSGKPEHPARFIAFSTSDSARDLAVLPAHLGFGCSFSCEMLRATG